MSNSLFSDNWYLLAKRCFSVADFVRVHTQDWNGAKWFVLSDPYTNSFFRVSEEAWAFLNQLDFNKSLDAVWKDMVSKTPQTTPGQTDVINLLSSLNQHGMLVCSTSNDLEPIFQGIVKKKKKLFMSRAMNFLFIPIPLWDPDEFLKRISFLSSLIFSFKGLVLWCAVIFCGIGAVINNWSHLFDNTGRILASENLIWLYFAWAGLKLFHETAHALSCRSFGGEVHAMGVMLIALAPVPYMDATSAWKISGKSKRALIGAAGVLAELFAAALASIIWANTGPGMINNLAFNIMIIGSVSSLAFNLNPLLRLDGYYILSDLLGFPNLHERAQQHLKSIFNKFFLGIRDELPELKSFFLKLFYPLFAVASGCYRFFVLLVISSFIATKFYTLGLLLSALAVLFWFFVPLFKLFYYFLFNPRVATVFPRGLIVSAFIIFLFYLIMAIFPVDSSFVCRGVINNSVGKKVITASSGLFIYQEALYGKRVSKDQILGVLINSDLDLEIEEQQSLKKKLLLRINQADLTGGYFKKALSQQLESMEQKIKNLEKEKTFLTIKAPADGCFWSDSLVDIRGRVLKKGTELGVILDQDKSFFDAVVTPEQVSAFFQGESKNRGNRKEVRAEIRLHGNANKIYKARIVSVSQSHIRRLPHISLGKSGGGIIDVDRNDSQGLTSIEPCFLVKLEFENTPAIPDKKLATPANKLPIPDKNIDFLKYHLQRGRVRFFFGKTTLFTLIKRRLIQLFQKKYRF